MDKKQYNINYYQKNKDKILFASNEYYKNNRDSVLQRIKEYYLKADIKVIRIKYRKEYYQKNKENNILKSKEYYKSNKKRIRLLRKRTKALIKGGGELSMQTLQQVYEDNIKKFGTLTCYLCLKPIDFGQDTLEHKTPLSRGGTNAKENLGIAHKSCNDKKHTKTVDEFLQKNMEV